MCRVLRSHIASPSASPLVRERDIRLALVLNGGVSLAIWIGGVTHEIDSARRASAPGSGPGEDAGGTAPLYGKLLAILRQRVIVDVIGGTSAGGINGVLLGAAIYTGNDLPNLREVWISLGDFRRLLRPSTMGSPPSILKGDDYVLPAIERELDALFDGAGSASQELHIFVPATDLAGRPTRYADSTGREFVERDHRRVFHFTSDPGNPAGPGGAMTKKISLGEAEAKQLLAQAARGSSSFPVAFEAHRLKCDDEGTVTERLLVDGGILDNQPFSPVLDQIAVLSAARPAKRVVLYVVPYVTEAHTKATTAEQAGTALETVSAALSLPRDLPKLQGLERVTREQRTLESLEAIRRATQGVASPAVLAASAAELFASYQATRLAASAGVFTSWAAPDFQPGDGVLAQSLSIDPSNLVQVVPEVAGVDATTVRWVPNGPNWSADDVAWGWGLSPAERAASWILLTLGEAVYPPEQGPSLEAAETTAGTLIQDVRAAKGVLVAAFLAATGDPIARGRAAYAKITNELTGIQTQFRTLDGFIEELNRSIEGGPSNYRPAARVATSLHLEVVRNAFGVQDLAIPLPFEFVFASAGVRNSLGHSARTPTRKLAGMKLNHFGGFLKRSWRANDWLWGRLDGVEHLLRAFVDEERLHELSYAHDTMPSAAPTLAAGETVPPRAALMELAKLALAGEAGAPESPAATAFLRDKWASTAAKLRSEPGPDPATQLARELERALAAKPDARVRTEILKGYRQLLAARFQLRILDEELVRVAQTAREDAAAGASPVADGVAWAERVLQREPTSKEQVELFRQMRIGEESLGDETSARQTADVLAQTVAVSSAMLAGDRGGLPAGGRALLGSIRSATLAASFPVRLFARSPALGMIVFALLIAWLVWAVVSKRAILGASVPILAIATALAGIALLTMATSALERPTRSAWRWVGWAAAVGVPAAFFVAEALGWLDGWLTEHCGGVAVGVAAILAGVAAALLVLDLFVLLLPRVWARTARWRRPVGRACLWGYRALVVGSLASLVVGFVLTRIDEYESGEHEGWAAVANERHGALLILTLFVILVLAGVILELLSEVRRRRSD